MPATYRSRPLLIVSSIAMPVARWTVIGTLLPLWLLSIPISAAEPLSEQDEFVQRLTEPHSGTIDGQPLRLAILRVAQPETQPDRHINIWIDRKVNPDAPVSLGKLGPTRYASLSELARTAGCACYPMNNCVLIGRPAWVAELSRRMTADAEHEPRSSPAARNNGRLETIDLRWPDLTTPTEALQLALAQAPLAQASLDHIPTPSAKPSSTVAPSESPINALPHDLWPAVLLRDISPQDAIEMIIGQFIDDPMAQRLNVPFRRAYRFGGAKRVLDSLRDLDPDLQATSRGGVTLVSASAALHQAFCQQILGSARAAANRDDADVSGADALQRLRTNPRVFSIKVVDKPAGVLIQTLLAQLDIECRFEPAANPQLEKLVSFSAVDQTLWQLVRLIAEKASLKIQADGDKLLLAPLN